VQLCAFISAKNMNPCETLIVVDPMIPLLVKH